MSKELKRITTHKAPEILGCSYCCMNFKEAENAIYIEFMSGWKTFHLKCFTEFRSEMNDFADENKELLEV